MNLQSNVFAGRTANRFVDPLQSGVAFQPEEGAGLMGTLDRQQVLEMLRARYPEAFPEQLSSLADAQIKRAMDEKKKNLFAQEASAATAFTPFNTSNLPTARRPATRQQLF